MKYGYIINEVKKKEYTDLKKEESEIISEAKSSFSEVWKPRIENIELSFKYNSFRSSIGIFVKRDEEQHLAIDFQELNKEENAAVKALHSTLEQKLDRLRLAKESWIN